MVFEHEHDDPDYVIYQRLIDGVWTDHVCEAANQICAAARFDFTGVQAGDRVSSLCHPLRVGDPRFRDSGCGCGHRTYETSKSAEQVRWVFAKHPKRWCCSATATRQWSPNSPAACPPCGVLQTAGSGPNALGSAHGGGRLRSPGRANRPPRRTTVDGPGDAYLHLGTTG